MSCRSCNFRLVSGDLVQLPTPVEQPKVEEPKPEKKKKSRYDKYLIMSERELEESGVIAKRKRR